MVHGFTESGQTWNSLIPHYKDRFQLQMTPGNLSSHLSKLEEAGYVDVVKKFIERKTHTALKLTRKGRDAFKEYQRNLKQVFGDL